jgi:aminoglycoside phosphotransferase (APT) family kinase protein
MSDVIDVKPQHRFDEARLDRYLAERIAGHAGPLTVRQFEGGQSNPTYFLSTPSAKYVLRRKPPGALRASAHAVDREYRILRALNATSFPVPRALLLCEDESVIGTAFFVMSHVAGTPVWDVSLPDSTREERSALIHSYVDTLADLHRFDPVALELADFGRPGNYFARQISRWSRQFDETETEPVPEMRELGAWLEKSTPAQTATAIVHGDYSFNNVLRHPTEPRVSAVLDWELSTIGDPLADFTYFTQPWFAAPGERSFAGRDLAALGVPRYEELRARYCARVGRPAFANEGFYRAFHAFRSAAILQGIIRRVVDGTNAGAMALQFTPADVRAGARRGLEHAMRNSAALPR